VVEKYNGLAQAMSRALKRKVIVVATREFSALEAGMKSGKMDFVMARPSDYPARGLRDYGYQLVSTAKPDGQCLLVVPQNSPIKTLQDAYGKRVALPEKVSYMSKFCSAELAHQNFEFGTSKVQYVREQGAVLFYIDNNFADVGGIASYSGVAKNLEKTGHRVIHKSAPQPYLPLIAHAKFSPAQIKLLKKELDKFTENDEGLVVLKTLGIKGFEANADDKRLRGLLNWLAG